jgi:UDP:flavonoid glycosyltransferase YjiC (YdhE family)
MRIILNTFGSFGDIHPYMAIALELQARGHVPVLATMEFYREKIEDAGLEFFPVRPNIPQPKEQEVSSAVWVARDFFQVSIEAAKRVGRRAVLLIGDERNRLDALPEGMIAVDYAPYEQLLPHAAVVVHHGGVGTTSQALLAGVPTLIVPFAFDQSDNAEHARRLGTSRTIYRDDYRVPRVAKELRELLEQREYVQNAVAIGKQLKQENGAARAANLIEQVLSAAAAREEEELVYAAGD